MTKTPFFMIVPSFRGKPSTSLLATALVALLVGCQSGNSTEQPVEGLSARDMVRNTQTASQPDGTPDAGAPAIAFQATEYDFGRVVAGTKVEHTFKFENVGKAPLLIQQASASCGCTVPQWPREPIAPGATGEIRVAFDSEGREGVQSKTVTILANTQPNTTRLEIRGQVLSRQAGPLQP